MHPFPPLVYTNGAGHGDAGAQALAALLKDSATLHTLTLDLTCNRIGDAGAQALAMLKDSTTLRKLTSLLPCFTTKLEMPPGWMWLLQE